MAYMKTLKFCNWSYIYNFLCFFAGAPARFSGRVGRLKKNKDSAQSAEKIFALPTLDPSLPMHPEIETQGGQA